MQAMLGLILILYGFVIILSYVLTDLLRRYALQNSLLDIPNHRSSHAIPTPRGGGLAFVFCFVLVLGLLRYGQFISFKIEFILAGIGSFLAFLGFLDDKYSLAAKWRLLGHFMAGGISIYCLGMPAISFGSWMIPVGLINDVLGIFYMVWLVNLYNFMDGIDGIASIEVVSVCLSAALIYYLHNETSLLYLPLGLAAAVMGFLWWNFPPARIFMGDVGSGFLGFVLGIFSIQAAFVQPLLFWVWLVLLGVFIVDASVTLICRGLKGERLFEAHCTHAYQNASRYYGNHRAVTLRVLGINIFWLLPWALLISIQKINGFSGLLIAYAPLLVIAFKFNAGKSIHLNKLEGV